MKLNSWWVGLKKLILKIRKKLQKRILVVRTEVLEVVKEVPVDKIVTHETEIPLTKFEVVETEVPITKYEVIETEVPVTKIEVVTTEVPIVIHEVVETEIPVTKIEVVEVDKIIYDQKEIDNLLEQTDKVMRLRDLFTSKSTVLENQYEQLLKVVDTLNDTVANLSKTIEQQQKTITQLHNTKLLTLEDSLKKSNVEKVYVENEINKELQEVGLKLREQLDIMIRENESLTERLNQIEDLEDKEKLRFYYRELYNFAFQNISPYTTFDQEEAKHYWDNLVK